MCGLWQETYVALDHHADAAPDNPIAVTPAKQQHNSVVHTSCNEQMCGGKRYIPAQRGLHARDTLQFATATQLTTVANSKGSESASPWLLSVPHTEPAACERNHRM